MNVSELHPKLSTTTTLSFDCPKCRMHKVAVIVGIPSGYVWNIERQTLSPSVNFEVGDCKVHFTITDGEVQIT